MSSDSYDENSIKVLEGTEGIRKRPAMYIGDVGSRGFHHLVTEVIDNSIDEAMMGRCSKVDVIIYPDNSISLRDDGAGIPAGIHPQYGVSTLEVILTKLHSGGKFEKKAYQVSGGLHGIGLAAVCALSETFKISSFRDKKIYTQYYEKGKKVSEVDVQPLGKEPKGTLIHFKPDTSIFTVNEFDWETLAGRFRELSYLTTKFRINFEDQREKDEDGNYKSTSFYYEGGIKQFVADIVGNRPSLIPDGETPIFHSQNEMDNVIVEIAFTYTDTYQENLRGYVNNINTYEGGTHISGFKTVLTRSINDFARDFKILKDNEANLSGNDVREGIIAIISVKVPDPQFEGQTKTKLGNSEVDGIVQNTSGKVIKDWLVDNQAMGRAIINKALLARRAREAAKKAKDLIRKNATGRVSLPGKLVVSRSRDPNERELYLVEGQSAGGTAVKARDAGFQEVLFLRGKVLNIEKARLNRALENQEIRNIITAVGTGILDEFDYSKCRYSKIILLTDADVDGAHIAILLFTFFYRYMRPIIEEGRLYIARPPLFKLSLKGKALKLRGTKDIYLQNDRELDAFMMGMKEMELDPKEIGINRFKGLGEMNSEQLEETAMDVRTRKIERLTINDIMDAEEWLVKLMGDDVTHRKQFIQNDVFQPQGLENRGEFYEVAFSNSQEHENDDTDEDDEEFVSEKSKEDVDSKLEDDLDEYSPENELLAALERLKF